MFTLEQINTIHDMYGKADTLGKYLQELRAIGIDTCDSFLSDGHSEHKGAGHIVKTPPVHEVYTVAETSDKQAVSNIIERQSRDDMGYYEMSKALAESGVEKWTFDTHALTLTYYDKAGSVLHSETIT